MPQSTVHGHGVGVMCMYHVCTMYDVATVLVRKVGREDTHRSSCIVAVRSTCPGKLVLFTIERSIDSSVIQVQMNVSTNKYKVQSTKYTVPRREYGVQNTRYDILQAISCERKH